MVRLHRIGWQPTRGASFLLRQTHVFTSPRQGKPLNRDSLLGMEYMVVVFYFKFMVLAIFSLLSSELQQALDTVYTQLTL